VNLKFKTKLFLLITLKEKRFIRSWQDQREGGKWSYYLLYTFGGGFIISIICYILLLWILQIRVLRPYWLVPAVGVMSAAILSVVVWRLNEKRFKKIIRREIRSGSPSRPAGAGSANEG
jgi:peptidoglycan/LPS O-acetylase OafA/YrhL